MRAAVVRRYGPPENVVIEEIPIPEPRAGEVLVRVEATAITAGDARIRAARFPKGFAPGAEVVGMAGARFGAHAEYVVVPTTSLATKPAGVSNAAAAAILFGGTTALYFLRDRAQVGPGDTVLVNGASGAVGSSAVQLAKHLGAEVTAVTSEPNTALVTRLGADHVIDYRQTPVSALSGPYDVVLDAVGNVSRQQGLSMLSPRGSFIMIVGSLVDTVRARGRVVAGVAPERPEDYEFLLQLAAQGEVDPVLDEVGGLETIQEAYRRIDSGHKVGNLVLAPGSVRP